MESFLWLSQNFEGTIFLHFAFEVFLINEAYLEKKICTLPWAQLSSSPMGGFNYCCEATETYTPAPGQEADVQAFWNSDYMQKVRLSLLNGDMDSFCQNCKTKENLGLTSMRTVTSYLIEKAELQRLTEFSQQNHGLTNTLPRVLDIRFSSKCNMRCRMCTAYNSSEIYKEYKNSPQKFQELNPQHWKSVEKMYSKTTQKWNIPNLVENCANIQNVVISGGEPLIQPEFYELLEELEKRQLSQQISLQITSNGSVFNQALKQKLRNFKNVRLILSIDAESSAYEYIRFPFKWDFISEQILKFAELESEKIQFLISPTLQALNVASLPRLLKWALDHKINFELHTSVVSPDYMALDILPIGAIKKLAKNLQKLLSHPHATRAQNKENLTNMITSLEARQNIDLHLMQKKQKSFLAHMTLLDTLRNQNLKNSVPEVFNAIHKKESKLINLLNTLLR